MLVTTVPRKEKINRMEFMNNRKNTQMLIQRSNVYITNNTVLFILVEALRRILIPTSTSDALYTTYIQLRANVK